MARGFVSSVIGNSPTAVFPAAAGRPIAVVALAVVAFVLVAGPSQAENAKSATPVGEVTVTAAPRIGGPAPGPCVGVGASGSGAANSGAADADCAARRLEEAAKAAQAAAQRDMTLVAPDARSPAAAIGLATPAAAAQQPGSAYGKPPGYRPPSPPPPAPSPFSRQP